MNKNNLPAALVAFAVGLCSCSGGHSGAVVSRDLAPKVWSGSTIIRFVEMQYLGNSARSAVDIDLVADFNGDGSVEPFGFENNGGGYMNKMPSTSISYVGGGPVQAGIGGGAVAADFNGDGVLDVLDDGYYGNTSVLYIGSMKNGILTFSEDPRFLGLNIKGYCETAVAADFNDDGLPDAYIPCYGDAQYRALDPNARDYLLIGDGHGGFLDMSELWGVAAVQPIRPEGAQAVDVDDDGYVDLYSEGRMHLNVLGSRFEISTQKWQLPGIFDEGVQFFDYNNDGLMDFAIWDPTLGGHVRLFRNTGSTFVEDVLNVPATMSRAYTWGLTVIDANNDGWEDLIIPGDGVVPNELLLNEGGTFVAVDAPGITDRTEYGAGGAVGDFNGDGLMDLYTRSGRLLMNISTPSSACGYRVRLLGVNGEQNQFGKVVRVYSMHDYLGSATDLNSLSRSRSGPIYAKVVNGGSGQASQNQYDLLFHTDSCGLHKIVTRDALHRNKVVVADSTGFPFVELSVAP